MLRMEAGKPILTRLPRPPPMPRMDGPDMPVIRKWRRKSKTPVANRTRKPPKPTKPKYREGFSPPRASGEWDMADQAGPTADCRETPRPGPRTHRTKVVLREIRSRGRGRAEQGAGDDRDLAWRAWNPAHFATTYQRFYSPMMSWNGMKATWYREKDRPSRFPNHIMAGWKTPRVGTKQFGRDSWLAGCGLAGPNRGGPGCWTGRAVAGA